MIHYRQALLLILITIIIQIKINHVYNFHIYFIKNISIKYPHIPSIMFKLIKLILFNTYFYSYNKFKSIKFIQIKINSASI